MKCRITKRSVDGLNPPDKGRTKVYDTLLTGFGVVVYASGKKSFFIEYGPKRRRRRMTLGQYGALTVDQARSLAKVELGALIQGSDPLDERDHRRQVPSVSEWVDEYLQGVRRRKKQPRHDERYLGEVKTRWGTRALDAVSRRAIQSEMERIGERGHTTANRWLASVRACFQAALRAGLVADNPAAGVRIFRENEARARVLGDAEFAKVVAAIDELDDPHVRAAFRLLIDTGARKSEVLRARWAELDLERGFWRIPSPKSGRPQVIPLTAQSVDMLRATPQLGEWLVPGRKPGTHRKDLKRQWEDIRSKVGIADVTIHDLRRTFGLHVANQAGLHTASKLLRHSDIRVTERVYVPLGIEGLREAVAATQAERRKVIALKRRTR